jgi:hypothetical protein
MDIQSVRNHKKMLLQRMIACSKDVLETSKSSLERIIPEQQRLIFKFLKKTAEPIRSLKNSTITNPKLIIYHNMKGPLFYSKILLFGEYGIIRDSKGLSIPYNLYNGALKETKILRQKLLLLMQV